MEACFERAGHTVAPSGRYRRVFERVLGVESIETRVDACRELEKSRGVDAARESSFDDADAIVGIDGCLADFTEDVREAPPLEAARDRRPESVRPIPSKFAVMMNANDKECVVKILPAVSRALGGRPRFSPAKTDEENVRIEDGVFMSILCREEPVAS